MTGIEPAPYRRAWIGVLAAIFCAPCLALAQAAPDAAIVLIRHVTLVSPERAQPLHRASVLIEGDRIRAVSTDDLAAPRGATVIDGRGRWLTPGLIDSHVHLGKVPGATPALVASDPGARAAFFAQQPRSYLYHGFTTVVEMSAGPPRGSAGLRAFMDAPLHPDVMRCGVVEIANGFIMADDDPAERREAFPDFIYDAHQRQLVAWSFDTARHTVAAVVRKMRGAGYHCLKMYYENGFSGSEAITYDVPSIEIMREISDAARRERLPLFLHANSWEAQRFGLEGGVGHFAHGLWHWGEHRHSAGLPAPIRETLTQIVERRVGYQPTFRVVGGQISALDATFLDDPRLRAVLPAGLLTWYASEPGQFYREAIREYLPWHLRRIDMSVLRTLLAGYVERLGRVVAFLAEQGAELLFGTDTVSGASYGNPPGLNGYLELQAWAAAGVPLPVILRAATLGNARALGVQDSLGTVASGRIANLLLLDADPLQSVEAWERIHTVVLRGRPIPRDHLRADR